MRSKAPKTEHHRGRHSGLIYEPAVVLFAQASLIMCNLRTKRRGIVGCGYTNQTAKAQRE